MPIRFRNGEAIYTLGLGLLLALLIVQLILRLRPGDAGSVWSQATLPVVGSKMPDAALLAEGLVDAGPASQTSLQSVLQGSKCFVLGFYDTACPFAQAVAPRWAGRQQLAIGEDSLQVLWIATHDSHAEAKAFVVQHGLGAKVLLLRDAATQASIGVIGSPLLYLVSADRTFLGRVPLQPGDVIDIPAACRLEPGT